MVYQAPEHHCTPSSSIKTQHIGLFQVLTHIIIMDKQSAAGTADSKAVMVQLTSMKHQRYARTPNPMQQASFA